MCFDNKTYVAPSADEKIWDASPIRDSANPEAEIGRPRTTIA